MRDHALMNAYYSEDLRKKKIVEALGRGTTNSEAARSFGVSRSSVKRYAKLAQEGRPLAPKKRPGLKPKLDEAARRLLEEDLEAHKGGRVREIVEGRGAELLYLPPYSPDMNPIEQAFSKVKGLLRQAESRTREALIGAMGRALDAVSARDARGFFGHCGYRSVGQPL
jgi:transposase